VFSASRTHWNVNRRQSPAATSGAVNLRDNYTLLAQLRLTLYIKGAACMWFCRDGPADHGGKDCRLTCVVSRQYCSYSE